MVNYNLNTYIHTFIDSYANDESLELLYKSIQEICRSEFLSCALVVRKNVLGVKTLILPLKVGFLKRSCIINNTVTGYQISDAVDEGRKQNMGTASV